MTTRACLGAVFQRSMLCSGLEPVCFHRDHWHRGQQLATAYLSYSARAFLPVLFGNSCKIWRVGVNLGCTFPRFPSRLWNINPLLGHDNCRGGGIEPR